jgi:hypothetical protein
VSVERTIRKIVEALTAAGEEDINQNDPAEISLAADREYHLEAARAASEILNDIREERRIADEVEMSVYPTVQEMLRERYA